MIIGYQIKMKMKSGICKAKNIKPHTIKGSSKIEKKVLTICCINKNKIKIFFTRILDQEEEITTNLCSSTMIDKNLNILIKERCNKLKKVFINHGLQFNFRIQLFWTNKKTKIIIRVFLKIFKKNNNLKKKTMDFYKDGSQCFSWLGKVNFKKA